ncbi:hypothetical protein K402DRAFT_431848 [Aulographum hederae CBS 113979]|uniref:Uncharacterized protein n=1 Tax=Aulographum hederae CBS 113979 TaxID=1176131 RepID=A0A6G1GZ03_9PEZI|nr:hypothetical protein K402DRAFT_431848 [Aulographum hederae CBS 113979]
MSIASIIYPSRSSNRTTGKVTSLIPPYSPSLIARPSQVPCHSQALPAPKEPPSASSPPPSQSTPSHFPHDTSETHRQERFRRRSLLGNLHATHLTHPPHEAPLILSRPRLWLCGSISARWSNRRWVQPHVFGSEQVDSLLDVIVVFVTTAKFLYSLPSHPGLVSLHFSTPMSEGQTARPVSSSHKMHCASLP